ncbi:MAG: MFS transporter [Planctomycetaceae bacterium]|nr:MFS transporter [Planctomycetaceae bacterium]
MALSQDWRQRLVMLCAMYIAQGIPWGFMVTALMSYLTQRGLTVADVSWLTGIVLLPWTFKLVWGPVIDTVTIRSMGRRRPWIIGSQFMMAVTLLGILWLGDLGSALGTTASDGGMSQQFVASLGYMFFIHNCFASLQDVSTDALAVDILPPAEQGRVNGLMWGSKLLGKAIGATVMAKVIAWGDGYRLGWGVPTAILVQFVLLLGIMMFPLFMLERPGERRFPWSKGQAQGMDGVGSFRRPELMFRELRRGFSLVTTWALFVYGLFHVVGWGIVEVISKPLYTQQLGWTYLDFSYVSGLAVSTELGGALAGGYIADRWGRRKVMLLGFGAYGLLHIIFASCPHLWSQSWFTAGYLILNPGALAIGSVGFLSMAMNISWTSAAATMFTVYMTLSNAGHVAGNWLVKWLRDGLALSYEQMFWVAGVVTIAPLLLLPLVNPATVAALRRGEPIPSHETVFADLESSAP